MDRRARIWTIGAVAGIFSIASSVLNVVFATNLGDRAVLSALRILLYIAFIVSLVNLILLAYFCTLFVKDLNSRALSSKGKIWGFFAGGAATAAVSVIVSGVALVWAVTKQNELPPVLHTAPTTLIGVWFAAWAVSAVLQVILYSVIGVRAKTVWQTQRASRLDLDFRSRAPSMSTVERPTTQHTAQSFGSQELTLHSPPRTPVSRGGSSTRGSSSTRVGTGSSKPKVIRHSNRSSFDVVPFPAGEAMSIDSVAFDNWDTSSVHQEMRYAIHSSPPVTRAGLETIPGSRPESTDLDGQILPDSPISSSPPHAATSDTATAVGWSSSPRQLKSSPPSSPVNFSRPTSRPTSSHYNKPAPPKFERFDSSMQDLIHPLFRPNSPRPPPIATAGTMVTASPMANTTITPRALARLRSNSHLSAEHIKAVPVTDQSETQSVEQYLPDSPTLGSPSLGSPGPSIVDEAELPPILPGFVLSAGSRSSLVGYGKRKSVKKDRPESQVSMGSRSSQMMI